MKKIITVLVFVFLIGSLSVVSQVKAQAQYNIKQMTPQVEQALESRRQRYDQLADLKQKGLIGENNNGYVEALKGGADVEDLVSAENKDRKVIYETIAQQNNLQGALGTIEKVFAQVQREKAQSGDMVQMPDGSWKKK